MTTRLWEPFLISFQFESGYIHVSADTCMWRTRVLSGIGVRALAFAYVSNVSVHVERLVGILYI